MTTDTEWVLIEQVRAFNRFYTSEMGVLNERFLDDRFTLPELRILFEVASGRTPMVSQLAEALHMDQGYVSRIVAALKRQGLVEGLPDAQDGRKKILTLTHLGASIYAELESLVRATVNDQLKQLTPEERQQLVGAMNSIIRLLKPDISQKSS